MNETGIQFGSDTTPIRQYRAELQPKVCPVCEGTFEPEDETPEEWEAKTYCSRSCWQGGRA